MSSNESSEGSSDESSDDDDGEVERGFDCFLLRKDTDTSSASISSTLFFLFAASVPTACAKKSATGAACHEALFGDSCVPGMYADIQGTAMTTGQMCKQCGTKSGKTAD